MTGSTIDGNDVAARPGRWAKKAPTGAFFASALPGRGSATAGSRYNRPTRLRVSAVRALTLPIKIIVFLLLIGFAARNSESVTLRYFLGLEWHTPLSLVILAAFAVGLLVGVLACSARLLRDQREIRTLRRQLHGD